MTNVHNVEIICPRISDPRLKLPTGRDITSKQRLFETHTLLLAIFSTAHCVWLKLKQIRRKQI